MYTPKGVDVARIENDFAYHKPHDEGQSERYDLNRADLCGVAIRLLERCPASRELSIALGKLEEAMFWANAAIARNEK